MTNRPVLVDTSVWVDYLRNGRSKEAEILDQMLCAGLVVTCEPVKAEIISGAPTKSEFERLRVLLGSLLSLNVSLDVWESIAEHRFVLARKGIQASLIDLWIVAAAREHALAIWTLDQDFHRMNKVIPFEIFHPDVS
jgi:predicted nucleic acid-binding protein